MTRIQHQRFSPKCRWNQSHCLTVRSGSRASGPVWRPNCLSWTRTCTSLPAHQTAGVFVAWWWVWLVDLEQIPPKDRTVNCECWADAWCHFFYPGIAKKSAFVGRNELIENPTHHPGEFPMLFICCLWDPEQLEVCESSSRATPSYHPLIGWDFS